MPSAPRAGEPRVGPASSRRAPVPSGRCAPRAPESAASGGRARRSGPGRPRASSWPVSDHLVAELVAHAIDGALDAPPELERRGRAQRSHAGSGRRAMWRIMSSIIDRRDRVLAEVLAEAEGAGHELPPVDGPLGHERHDVVHPADEQPGVHPAGEVARAEAHEHRVGRQIGEGEVHRAAAWESP